MSKLNSRLLLRRIALTCVAVALSVPVTTYGGMQTAGAATPAKNTMEAVFVLPPDREQTPETVNMVIKYLEDGRKAYELNQFEKAISKFQEAYGLAREIKYTDGEGMALTEMCLFYQQKNQVPRAKELGENAIEVLSNSADKKSLGKARVAMARVYLMLDNTYDASAQLSAALESFNDLSGVDSEEIAKVLMLGADIARLSGHEKEALQFYEAAAGYAGQAGKTREQVATQVRLVDYLIAKGALTAALEEANKALTGARNAQKPQPAEIACALNALANAQYCLCEFAEARKSYEELLSMKVPDQAPITRAIYLEGYAFALIATGDYDVAKDALEKALPVVKSQGSVAHRAQILNALGVIASQHGDFTTGMTDFKQALDASSLINPKQPKLSITILQNLASAQARAGENRNAKVQIGNALQTCSGKNFNDKLLQARTLAGLSDICLTLKEYPEAEAAIQKGLTIAQSINDDTSLWRLYTNLAQVQIATGVAPNESLQSALSFFRSPQAGDFASPVSLTFPTRRDEKGFELVSLLVQEGMIEQALLAAEQLKDETFINEWHHRGGAVRQADRDIYVDMVTRRAHLHAAESASLPSTVLNDWKEWVGRFQHIAAENPSLARLIAPVPISLAEVVKTVAPNHEAVVDYLVGGKSTVMFTLDTNRRLTAYKLSVGKDELQRQVGQLLTASQKNDDQARATEHRLLTLLFTELLPEEARRVLPQNPDQTIVVIPDSVLFNLPFAALITPQGRYLVEQHTLTLAPSLNVLMNPPHHTGDMSVVVASQKPNESETTQISSVFDPQQVAVLAGKDTDINKLQEQVKSSSIIHFSTAMNIPQNNALQSPMPLVASPQAGDKVTANSLFEMNLPSDLAVLSASSVNARDVKGNGVQVFTRGLNYAGVRNVLMSLWVAPDPARTAELMDFYRSQNKGMSQAQSLRKAQMLALSKDPSPRMWAAFQLLGPGF